MIDFIFGVTNPEEWHSINYIQNPSHYSFVGMFGRKIFPSLFFFFFFFLFSFFLFTLLYFTCEKNTGKKNNKVKKKENFKGNLE